MRLTLRTMLAYLDDILEPGDAEELSQKIEESKFAAELVHRIRSSTRRLRLGAPKLEGRGMGLDPNTVAEYLDNTLSTDHVPDFEKVCLESDVHLAEVASSHQILALVLGEPAEIDQKLRERVYRIGRPSEETGLEETADDSTAPDTLSVQTVEDVLLGPPEAPLEATAPLAEEPIPDYMTAGTRLPVKSLAITFICAFALAVVALLAVGPAGRERLYQFFVGADETDVAQAPVENAGDEQTPPAEPKTSADVTDESASTAMPAAAMEGSETDDGDPVPNGKPAPSQNEEPVPKPEVVAPPAPVFPKPEPSQPLPDVMPVSPAEKDRPDSVMTPPKPEATEVVEPTSVGRFISDEQVLGRLDRESGDWFRLQANAPLAAGDRLMVLPSFRPQVLLAGTIKMTFSGATVMQLEAATEPDVPKMVIDYGKTTIVAVDDRGARVRLDLAGRSGEALFADAESALAVEVIPYRAPGTDPLAKPALMIVGLYATSGQVAWSEGPGDAVKVSAGQVLVLTGDAAPQVLDAGPLPAWIDGRDLTDTDRRASAELKTHLTSDRPLGLSLMEKTEFRQIEVRVLACRCLSYMDFFEPILKALDDESHHAYWHGHFDTLQAALARNRESAAAVLAAVETRHAEDAEGIFRLLWGYSPPQLEAGADHDIVDFLENDAMIARVLARENLRRITGKTLQYRPEQRPDQEKSKIMRWRRDLDDGLIRYKSPPSAMPSGPAPPAKKTP